MVLRGSPQANLGAGGVFAVGRLSFRRGREKGLHERVTGLTGNFTRRHGQVFTNKRIKQNVVCLRGGNRNLRLEVSIHDLSRDDTILHVEIKLKMVCAAGIEPAPGDQQKCFIKRGLCC